MADRRRLIVVANRAPVTFEREPEGDPVARRGGGGLVTALRSVIRHCDVVWVASALSEEDRLLAEESGEDSQEAQLEDGSPYRLRFVAHDPQAYDAYYNVVANPFLWFLHHYLFDLAREPDIGSELLDAWRTGYIPVNRNFARAVASELARRPDSLVFVHDYHLYGVPAFVRDEAAAAAVGYVVHTPWPQSDYWHILPLDLRRSIHAWLLASDVLSFHTERWRKNFLGSCADVLGAQVDAARGEVHFSGRVSRTLVSPISVDPDEFDRLAGQPQVRVHEARIERSRPELLVVRVERTDLSKNIVRGFQAFARCLERHPELAGRAGMLALLHPSRQEIPEYEAYFEETAAAAAAVNERLGWPGWTPISVDVSDDFPQAVAAYRQYDVLLVNPIFDGMNLVAKEGPLVNCRDGVLVLSENAGAYEELGEWAIGVNPFDLEQQAEAIYRALTMPPAERRRRAQALRAQVRERHAGVWLDEQVSALDRAAAARPAKHRVRRSKLPS